MSSDGRPRFEVEAGNGEVILAGETYQSNSGAQNGETHSSNAAMGNGIAPMKSNAPGARVEDLT